MNVTPFSTFLAGLLISLLAVGCSDAPPATTQQAGSLADRETWNIYTIAGTRVGYGHTTISHTSRSGRKIVQIEGLNHLAVKRFGERTEQEIRFKSTETPDGKLIEFHSEIQLGPTPVQTTGRVIGNRLEMKMTTRGKTTSTSIPWSAEYGGLYASEQTLLRRPMQPGQHRTIHALAVGFNQVATIEMTARDYQPVELLTGTYNLLRIDTVMRFPDGQTITGTVWSDRTGETLKTRIDAMQIETFRATKALALQQQDLGEFDLGTDIAVKLDRPIPRPHETKRIRYRVRLEGGDPAGVFVAGPSQQIKSIDPHTAELTVYSLRPGGHRGGDEPADPPTDDDQQPNNLIQSDNPKIVAMARKAAGDETDPWKTAVTLERYVTGLIEEKDFSQAFATAAEVAENPVGDCTEHAVLLAALCRARGVPARVAVGLVYMQGSQSFGYHAWNEVYVGGRWIPIDATLAGGGIGAAHLKLAHTSLKGASAYSSFLPIIQVAGRLKIKVLETTIQVKDMR